MADTAHKTDAEIVEHHDDPEELNDKIDQLADLISNSKNFTIWTGAGVSTSCGIPDFRGPNGKWTLKAQGREMDPKTRVVNSMVATPSVTHMSIVSLLQHGLLKHLISTNTDGLHCRSGVHLDKISELHGNGQKMRCDKCAYWAFMDTRCRVAKHVHDHKTDYKCPQKCCTGTMCDTIINFGEYLHSEVTTVANAAGEKADLILVLGSSLRVITCDALEAIERNGGKLVIVNLQITPYDEQAFGKGLRIFANCDEVMVPLMAKLGLTIPPWVLHRYISVETDGKGALTVQGLNERRHPYSFFTAVNLCDADGKSLYKHTVPKDMALKPAKIQPSSLPSYKVHSLELVLPSYRGEPNCSIPIDLSKEASHFYCLDCDVKAKTWSVS